MSMCSNVLIDIKDDIKGHSDKCQLLLQDLMSVFDVKIQDTVYDKVSKINKGDKGDSTIYVGMLKIAWKITPAKHKFLFFMMLAEIVGFLSIAGYTYKIPLLILIDPILSEVVQKIKRDYESGLISVIRSKFERCALNYFQSLCYKERKQNENMEVFSGNVDSASNSLAQIVTWGIPTNIHSIVSIIKCLFMFGYMGYYAMIPIIIIGFYVFYTYAVKKQQLKIGDVKEKLRDANKKWYSISMFRMSQFQNKKRTTEEVVDEKMKPKILLQKYVQAWENVSSLLTFISSIITVGGLMMMDNWEELLVMKILFSNMCNAIQSISSFINNLTSQSKEFDKFKDWYDKTSGPVQQIKQLQFPKDGFSCKVNLNFSNFSLITDGFLNLKPKDVILLKGPSNCGKTQLVNAIQGLITGANSLTNVDNLSQFEESFEYMNQQTREVMPSNDVSLRELLDGEQNDDLIVELVSVVLMTHKFQTHSDFDVKMNALSGGEKMRLSLIYALHEYWTRHKNVLILDEPEQGLDEKTRVDVLQNIIKYCRIKCIPLLIIYHGSTTDLIELHFDKVWHFDVTEITDQLNLTKQTVVKEHPFEPYRLALVDKLTKKLIKKTNDMQRKLTH